MDTLSLYEVLIFVFAAAMGVLGVFLGTRKGLSAKGMGLYGLVAVAAGLTFGRLLYCAVCWYEVFFDAMGEFLGMLAIWQFTLDQCNVIGVLCGVLIAARLAAVLVKESNRQGDYLDAAAIPALGMYILARVIEPLTGQGYGDFMEMYVDVCYVEAILTAIVLGVVIWLSKRVRRPGTLCQYALVLWALTQIFPEALRCDNVLYVFVFARVTHLGLACTVGFALIRLLKQGTKRGLSKKEITLDVLGLTVGIGLCIGMIFALDKTNWPKLLVYAGLLLALVELGFVVCRRIRKEDLAA